MLESSKNVMLVGKSKPSVTFSTVRLLSLTVGPKEATGAFAYAPKSKLIRLKVATSGNLPVV